MVTGFDDLPADIGQGYHTKMMAADGYKDCLPVLLALAAQCATTEALLDRADHEQKACCKGLVFLWYAAELISWASANSQLLDKNRMPPAENEYYSGLIWRAIRAHPLALSGGYYGHWKYEPEN
ncbi:MAG: hypothetical protein ICV83_11205 [Cytophagales bacterium]|nr:hypothetical protein [Cytophagales bacterium]